MAYIVMAYIVMAYIVLAYIVMACIFMADIGMAVAVAAQRGAHAEGGMLRHNYISASPTACPLRGYGRAGTQNDRLGEAVILNTGTPILVQWTCRRRCRYRANIEPKACSGMPYSHACGRRYGCLACSRARRFVRAMTTWTLTTWAITTWATTSWAITTWGCGRARSFVRWSNGVMHGPGSYGPGSYGPGKLRQSTLWPRYLWPRYLWPR